ncbi:hypothetical protein MUK42_11273 [Musa troglodytarum]|uniref:Uncharacterized protein n=1 Tax=Musa troglodytarum TaxID=320322 RepID=A0A9E7KHB9_9LILI|nr:hypothetical protein MUK42_11273 [Musa troglodytarum]
MRRRRKGRQEGGRRPGGRSVGSLRRHGAPRRPGRSPPPWHSARGETRPRTATSTRPISRPSSPWRPGGRPALDTGGAKVASCR